MKLLKDYFDKQKRKATIEKMDALGEKIFLKYGYRKDDKVDSAFLFDMLSKGYIDESYPLYIAEVYEGTLSVRGLHFLNAVNSGENIGFDYKLEQSDCEQLCERITSWDSLGILNYSFAKYIVEHGRLRENYFPIFLDQIYKNDKDEKSKKFFDQFWESSRFNTEREIEIFEQIGKKINSLKPLNFLNVFFNNHNVARFRNFFDYFSKTEGVNKNYLKVLFEDNKDFYSDYIIRYKDDLESINTSLKQMKIQVDLTTDIVQQLPIESLLKITEFPVTKYNYDLLLLKENASTESLGYMTRCVEMNVDKSSFDEVRISDFCKNILMTFDNVEESVATEESVFKVAEKNLLLDEKIKLFKKTQRSWKDILAFYRGAGWDEILFDAITKNVFPNGVKSKEKKVDIFLRDYVLLGKNFAGSGYKWDFEKLLGDVLQSQLVSTWDNLVLSKALEVWSKYASVIDSLKKMKSIDDMNRTAMPYVMSFVFRKEIKYLDKDIVLELYRSDEKSFINYCRSIRFPAFRLWMLKNRDESRLKDAQKIILEYTYSLPDKNEIDFRTYKDAALEYVASGAHVEEVRVGICSRCVMYIDEVISILNKVVENEPQMSGWPSVSPRQRDVWIEMEKWLEDTVRNEDVKQDIWLLLLTRTLKNTYKKLTDIIKFNSSAQVWVKWLKKLRDEFGECGRIYY